MLGETSALNDLLCHDITCCEEHRCRDRLREQGPRVELGLVPVSIDRISIVVILSSYVVALKVTVKRGIS